MKIPFLGLEVLRTKQSGLAPVYDRGGWWPIIREPRTGDWQRNVTASVQDAFTNSTAWSCITLIASDIAQCRQVLKQASAGGVQREVTNPAYSPVLRRPNHYQNALQFIECWQLSLGARGNTYALKERDGRGVVVALYILDPTRVQVLTAPDGSVFYSLWVDSLSGLPSSVVVPAREIIHDRINPIYHPLVGVPPLWACALELIQSQKMLANTSAFFSEWSPISGVISAPGPISDAAAKKIVEHWEAHFGGKVALIENGMKFDPVKMSAVDAQLIDQLKISDARICGAYGVPGYMVGVGPLPGSVDIESLSLLYKKQCLAKRIRAYELCLTAGLAIEDPLSVELDETDLDRMDGTRRMDEATKSVKGGIRTPNEARAIFDLPPLDGGDTVYLQEQDHSLAALAKRDAGPDPFGTKPKPEPKPVAGPEPVPPKGIEAIDALRVKALLAERVA